MQEELLQAKNKRIIGQSPVEERKAEKWVPFRCQNNDDKILKAMLYLVEFHEKNVMFYSYDRNAKIRAMTSGIETYPKKDSRQHQSTSPEGNKHAQPQKRRIQPQGMEQPQAMDIEQDIPNKKIRLDHHGSKAVNQQKREDSKNTKSKTKAQDRLKKFRDPSSNANHQVVSHADIVQDIPIDVDVGLSESDIVNQNVPVPMQIAPNDEDNNMIASSPPKRVITRSRSRSSEMSAESSKSRKGPKTKAEQSSVQSKTPAQDRLKASREKRNHLIPAKIKSLTRNDDTREKSVTELVKEMNAKKQENQQSGNSEIKANSVQDRLKKARSINTLNPGSNSFSQSAPQPPRETNPSDQNQSQPILPQSSKKSINSLKNSQASNYVKRRLDKIKAK